MYLRVHSGGYTVSVELCGWLTATKDHVKIMCIFSMICVIVNVRKYKRNNFGGVPDVLLCNVKL